MNIEIVSGSPRRDSVTHRVVLFLQKYLSENTTHTIKVIDVRDWNLDVLQQEDLQKRRTSSFAASTFGKTHV